MKITGKIKLLFVFALTLLFAQNSEAQTSKSFDQGFRLGVGINGGLPTKNDTYDWALGGDVRLQYDLTQKKRG